MQALRAITTIRVVHEVEKLTQIPRTTKNKKRPDPWPYERSKKSTDPFAFRDIRVWSSNIFTEMHTLRANKKSQAMHKVKKLTKEGKVRRTTKKIYKKRQDPFALSAAEEFLGRYRFTKPTARFIVELVMSDLVVDRRGAGTSPELQVLTALGCWGRRRMVCSGPLDNHGLSRSTTSRICVRVAHALGKHSATYIHMPNTSAEEQEVMRDFKSIKNFPSVIGCIDCTQILIKKVWGEAAKRKAFTNLNVQVTCDARLQIRDIMARWEGSHDDVFRESSLMESFEAGTFKGLLLGDSNYKLEQYLLTPVLRPGYRAEERYNEALNATRKTVDCCIAVWKQRFPCLLGMSTGLANVEPIIMALAVLHNIAIRHGDALPEEDISLEDYPKATELPEEVRQGLSHAVLDAFIARHFND